jgi:pilus assembly protein Flp/PilA
MPTGKMPAGERKGGQIYMLRMLKDESGQGLVEYALIIALISLAALSIMSVLGRKISNSLSKAALSLS